MARGESSFVAATIGAVKRHLVRLAGVGFAVLVLVSEVLKGDSVSPNAPAGEIVDFLVDGRTGILAVGRRSPRAMDAREGISPSSRGVQPRA